MLPTSSTKRCGFSQGIHALPEWINSFCADFHMRSASVFRNTVGVQSGMRPCSWQTLGLYLCYEGGFAAEAGSLLRRCRWRRMHTAPHLFLLKIVSVDGFIMLIVSGWSYWETCLAHLLWKGPFSCCFVSEILQYSESPWIISPTNVSKESESLIKFALDAANPPAFSPTFMKNVFHLISAAGAAE